MIRKIIKIDEEKCNGCGVCISACHEGAIGLVNGKARLLRDDYCDGLGDCLPTCPTEAITFEEREAAAYDELAVKARAEGNAPDCGCPGTKMRPFERAEGEPALHGERTVLPSRLRQWPVQIKLVPPNAPYFDGAHLLISADCSAYAHGDFHESFMKDRVTLIGCPKLDDCNYSEKLTQILLQNNIKSVKAVRMEVPCCGGIEHAVITALENSGKMIPWQVVTLSINGEIIGD